MLPQEQQYHSTITTEPKPKMVMMIKRPEPQSPRQTPQSPRPQQQRKQHKKKKHHVVTFNPNSTVRRSLRIEDMSQVEIDATWVTRNEYKRIVKREKALMNRLRTAATTTPAVNDIDHQDFLITHGLECPDSRMQKRLRMREGLLSVLLEQEQQWEEDRWYDPDELARVSQSTTRKSAMLARERAIRFERSVQRDLLKDPTAIKLAQKACFALNHKQQQQQQQQQEHLLLPVVVVPPAPPSAPKQSSPCQKRWQTCGGISSTTNRPRSKSPVSKGSSHYLVMPARR